MLVLVVGCVLAAWGGLGSENYWGVAVCVASVLSSAAWTVLSAILMQAGEKPLDAVSLLFVSGPTCIFTLLCFFAAIDLPRLLDSGGARSRSPPPRAPCAPARPRLIVSLIAVAALLASLYDIVHNQFVKLTSSMNMAIMGNAKLALLIVLSTLTLETNALTPLRVARHWRRRRRRRVVHVVQARRAGAREPRAGRRGEARRSLRTVGAARRSSAVK